jgi:serine protease Do
VAAVLAVGTVLAAEDDRRIKIERKGKIKIVTVDEDGGPREETIEWESDKPQPWLGVGVGGAAGGGARVEHVAEGSPAEKAGIREGDILVGIDGREIKRPLDLTARILAAEPGQRVALELIRDGERQTVTAELGERESEPALLDLHDFGLDSELLKEPLEGLDSLELEEMLGPGRRPVLGVQLVEPTAELREHLGGPAEAGVLVSRILPGTPAERSGIQIGDLIVAVDGQRVEDAGDLADALRSKDGQTIRLELVRDRRSMSLSVALPEREREETPGPQA